MRTVDTREPGGAAGAHRQRSDRRRPPSGSPRPGSRTPGPTPKCWSPTRSGSRPSELSVDSADEVSEEVAAAIEERVARRVDREPMAYILGRAPFRGLEIAVDERVLWPRTETELLVQVGSELPEGARVHEVGTGSGAIALALDLRAAGPAGHRLGPLAGGGRSGARERRAPGPASSTSGSAVGLPDDLEDVDLVIANLPYVTDETIFERSPEIQQRAADRRHRRLRRGRPRRDPRPDRRNALGLADGARARHPSRAGDAGAAARRDYPSRL